MTKTSNMTKAVEQVLTDLLFFCGDDPAIPSLWVRGKIPLFLVLGENASGKSFFRRCVQQWCRKYTSVKEVIHISMEGRAGVNELGAMKAFVYGDEDMRSTGENSAMTVRTAIRTCEGRDHSHVMYWDEPDVGMSEGAAAGVGIAIADFVDRLPSHTKGIFITTHSRALVEPLLRVRPHYLHLGTDPAKAPQTLDEWLRRPVAPISPEELLEQSRRRFGAIQKVLNAQKRAG